MRASEEKELLARVPPLSTAARLVDADQRLLALERHGAQHRIELGAAAGPLHRAVRRDLAHRLALQPVGGVLEGRALRRRHPRQQREQPDPRALAQDLVAAALELLAVELDAVVQVAQALDVALRQIEMVLQRRGQQARLALEVGEAGLALRVGGDGAQQQRQAQADALHHPCQPRATDRQPLAHGDGNAKRGHRQVVYVMTSS